MKTTVTKLLLPVTLVAVFIASTTACGDKKDKDNAALAEAEEAPVIDVAKPTVDNVTLYKTYPGYLSANNKVDLVARVDGTLKSHPYTDGSYVQKGAVLFVLENKQYQDAIDEVQAQIDNEQAQYDYYKKQYAAMQKAFQSEAVSEMEVLQAKSNMEGAEATIRNLKAQLADAQNTLSYCTIKAPFAGHISASSFSDGAYIAGAGSPVTLAQIYDDKIVTANFNIDDNELVNMVNSGSLKGKDTDLKHIPVEFSDSLPHRYTADLSYLSPVLDVSTGQMVVQAHIDNSYNELRPGMVATIKFPTKVVDDAILIEDAAISKDQLGSYVYVVNDDNKVVYTPITTGELVTPTKRLVTKGLGANDRYVTKALLKVRDGMKVKPRMTE